MLSTSEETLESIFNQAAGHSGAVERVKKIHDYCFVHFHDRDDALRALNVLNSTLPFDLQYYFIVVDSDDDDTVRVASLNHQSQPPPVVVTFVQLLVVTYKSWRPTLLLSGPTALLRVPPNSGTAYHCHSAIRH